MKRNVKKRPAPHGKQRLGKCRININVFYHINALHDWYKSHLSYNWTNSWDNNSRFNAEVNHTYNYHRHVPHQQ